MITRATFDYLRGLAAHNNRPWFLRNRPRYEAARAEVIELVDAVLAGLAHFEPHALEIDPADCLFRIHRDTRFSRGDEPYKTNFGAFVSDRGRRVARAGYYVHVEPGECLVAAGLYLPPPPELKSVRRALLENAAELRGIIRRPAFRRAFGDELPGDRLKTVPRGVPKNHPDADLLRYTSFAVWRGVADRTALSPRFAKQAIADFRTAHGFVQWLNGALDRGAG